jgi:hypothetical protein
MSDQAQDEPQAAPEADPSEEIVAKEPVLPTVEDLDFFESRSASPPNEVRRDDFSRKS